MQQKKNLKDYIKNRLQANDYIKKYWLKPLHINIIFIKSKNKLKESP